MHLSESDIASYLDHVVADDKRRQIEGHLADCASCVSRIATVARITTRIGDSAAPAVPEEAIRKAEQIVQSHSSGYAQHRPARTLRFAFGGVGLVLCVLVMMFVLDTPEVSRFRSHGEEATSMSLLAPVDGATFGNGEVFRWRATRAATAYRFTLFDHAGLPVWEQVASETTLTLPPTVELHNGGRYLWQVEALFPDQSVERSDLRAVLFSP